MYYTNIAKIIQFRILEEELLLNDEQESKEISKSEQKVKEEKKSMLTRMKNLSIEKFSKMFKKYGLDKVKELPKKMGQKLKGFKDKIFEKIDKMGSKLKGIFKKKKNQDNT